MFFKKPVFALHRSKWRTFREHMMVNTMFAKVPAYILIVNYFSDIEAQIREIQSKKKEVPVPETTDKGVKLGEGGYFDSEIYESGKSKYDGYVTSIAANDEVDDDEEDMGFATKRTGLGAPVALLNDVAQVSNCVYFIT